MNYFLVFFHVTLSTFWEPFGPRRPPFGPHWALFRPLMHYIFTKRVFKKMVAKARHTSCSSPALGWGSISTLSGLRRCPNGTFCMYIHWFGASSGLPCKMYMTSRFPLKGCHNGSCSFYLVNASPFPVVPYCSTHLVP